jgi:hypothetical protein
MAELDPDDYDYASLGKRIILATGRSGLQK